MVQEKKLQQQEGRRRCQRRLSLQSLCRRARLSVQLGLLAGHQLLLRNPRLRMTLAPLAMRVKSFQLEMRMSSLKTMRGRR